MTASITESGRVTQAEVLEHGLDRVTIHADALNKRLIDMRQECDALVTVIACSADSEATLEYLARELKRMAEQP